MKTKYFKCILKTDIVLNASLATEGNMNTLDYIPGSNFLGVVAKEYKKFKNEGVAFDIFHSGKVSFGDALIAVGNAQSYAMPFSLFQDKLRKGITDEENPVWVHHYLKDNHPDVQLKQNRGGYFNPDNFFIDKPERKFSLKSAHDRKERRSKEGAIFGFESLRKGQDFIFSVDFADDSVSYIEDVCNELIGLKRVGKSKTAQYGQVKIEPLEENPKIFNNGKLNNKRLIIYAESNLCLLNEYGQSTFQPTARHFGVEGKIDWSASQIRTYSYSPWNFHRNTTNTQRDCILKGSVLVINLDENIKTLPKKVGEYIEDGLGRIIYNPDFLLADEKSGIWKPALEKPIKEKRVPKEAPITTPLANLLNAKKIKSDIELGIGNAVLKFMKDNTSNFNKVSASQWGAIRSKSMQVDSIDKLCIELFSKKNTDGKDIGFLMHGVSAQKYWNKGNIRKNLQKAILENRKLGLAYVIKLSSEMAKWESTQKDKQ